MPCIFNDVFLNTRSYKQSTPLMPYTLDGDHLLRKTYYLFHKASDMTDLSHGARSILFFLIGDMPEMKKAGDSYSLPHRLALHFHDELPRSLSDYVCELVNVGVLVEQCARDMTQLFTYGDEED